ncbi:hypothetical protein KDW_37020 [Dictyobacter vulcani]|uniref:Mersacidin/lichenicidin family type 2 lantibiotic n=1 Tax=Dictyobacter vulcani TaxID=2607529 RepID=A0A5J4KSV6_9CHLR|nr:mersacidin/lichenicidin family type 2 lantibiotic [Dictyobacter vulcani]GER89540.1 hypothetical protein KDW_37020 [Dictyobacter vulcani]
MTIDITRAWKDAQYRDSLTSEQLAQIPANPVGSFELNDGDLANINGATSIGTPVASTSNSSSLLGVNLNVGGCCSTAGYAQDACCGTVTGSAYQGGRWHLSYVYDDSGSSCCSTGGYTTGGCC